MQPRTKLFFIIALVFGFLSAGFLGYTSYQLKKTRDNFAADLKRSESRNKLLTQKYKEKKAELARNQRENLLLMGQVRQAEINAEKFGKENKRLLLEIGKIEKELKQKLASCKEKKGRLSEAHKKLKTSYGELKKLHRQTSVQLKVCETEVRNTKSELGRVNAMNKRYKSHNVNLSTIARDLVSQIEKKELGTSILVKEPLIQFERVELESILQEYLDKIDDEKIVY